MVKKRNTFLIILILLCLIPIKSLAASFSLNNNVEKQDNDYIITFSLGDISKTGNGICMITCDIVYDEKCFEKLISENIEGLGVWQDTQMYNEEKAKLLLLKPEESKNEGEEVFSIRLKAKDNIEIKNSKVILKNINAFNDKDSFNAKDIKIVLEKRVNIFLYIAIIIVLIALIVVVKKVANKKGGKK